MRVRIVFPSSLLLAFFALSHAHPQQQKALVNTTSVRLAKAKNILVVRARGSIIPFDVIKSTLDGWGRFTIVEKAEQADLVVQISTSGGDSSVSMSSSQDLSSDGSRIEESSHSSRDLSANDITMTVLDAKDKRVLWIANETVKFALKEKVRQNNLVEAAERLAIRFHDRVEPPPPQDKN
jgi:hypothetical protein